MGWGFGSGGLGVWGVVRGRRGKRCFWLLILLVPKEALMNKNAPVVAQLKGKALDIWATWFELQSLSCCLLTGIP